jgi:hypothetical protein
MQRAKDSKPLQPADVFPWLAAEPEKKTAAAGRQTPEEMRRLMEQLTFEMGGIVKPRNRPLG